MNIERLDPEGLPPTNGYSHVVTAPAGARLVFVSGQVGLDARGELPGDGGIEAQVRQAFANLEAALRSVGSSTDRILKIGLYLTDAAHLPALRRVRNEIIDLENPPASTLLLVSGLFRPDLLVEVEATALA